MQKRNSPLKSVWRNLLQKDLNQETGELKRVQFYPWANFDKWQWALDKKEVKKKEKKGELYLWNSISQWCKGQKMDGLMTCSAVRFTFVAHGTKASSSQ